MYVKKRAIPTLIISTFKLRIEFKVQNRLAYARGCIKESSNDCQCDLLLNTLTDSVSYTAAAFCFCLEGMQYP